MIFAELKSERELSVVTRLACGALAGTVGQTVAYPLDVVRRRMQVRTASFSGSYLEMTLLLPSEGSLHSLQRVLPIPGFQNLPRQALYLPARSTIEEHALVDFVAEQPFRQVRILRNLQVHHTCKLQALSCSGQRFLQNLEYGLDADVRLEGGTIPSR